MTTVATAGPLSLVTPSASPVSPTQDASSTTPPQESFTQILSGQSAPTTGNAATSATASSEQIPTNVQSPRTALASDQPSALDAGPTLETNVQPAASATPGTAGLVSGKGAQPTRSVHNGVNPETTQPLTSTSASGVTKETSPTASPRGRSGPTLADIPLTSSPSSITDARGTRASAATTVPGTRAQAPRGPVRNKEATTSSKKGTPPTAPDRSNAPVDAGAQGVTAVTLPPAPVTDTGHASKATPTASGTPSYERGPTSGAANVMNNAGSPRVAPSDTKVMPPAIAPSDQTAGATPVVTSPPVAPSHTEVASTSQGLLVAQTQGAHVASDTAKASEVSVGLSLPAAARSSKTVATNVVIPSSSGSEGSASKANAATGNVPAPSASASSTAREVVSFAQNPPVTPPVTGTAVATPTASSFPTVDITSLVPGPDSGPSTANSVMGSASNSQSVAPFREAVSSARGAAQSSSSRTSVSSLETLAGSVGAAVHVNTSATSVSTQPTMSLGASTIASSHGVAGALGETRLSTLDVGGLSSAISRPLSEGNGTYSVSLAMHPIELGHVQAVMTLSGGELQVSLTAHTEHGHAALTASMNDLKNELARGGVNVTIDLRNPQSQTPDEGRTRRATESTSRPTAPTTTFATAPTPARDTGQIHLML